MKNRSTIIMVLIFALILVGRYFYFKPAVNDGETALNFSSKTIENKDFSLNQLKGKYVILDFWGSWCGPCRRDNPKLVKLYKDFNNKTFKDASSLEIVSVGIEGSELRWKNAIEKDNLAWEYHILDKTESLRFFDAPISNLYGIKQVPTKYFIDPNGKIIGIDQSFSEIATYLADRVQ